MIGLCFREVALGTTGKADSGCGELETELGTVVGEWLQDGGQESGGGHQIRASRRTHSVWHSVVCGEGERENTRITKVSHLVA